MISPKVKEEQARDPFDLSDYLQLASLRRHTLLLQVLSPESRHLGWVEIVDGQVWCASAGLSVAEDALSKLLFGGEHQVVCSNLDSPGRPREIHLPMENLLLELARRQDERERRPRLAPALLEGASRLQPWGESDDFNLAFLQGFRAAMEGDYPLAVRSFRLACELRPSDFRVRANLAQALARA
ncbi:MAG: DUF4388 domain-containing protein [Deltaproteobacteria bacterium]|nr:DUF4388 domain-containing protein [Deltaproteobacteria bacterium]